MSQSTSLDSDVQSSLYDFSSDDILPDQVSENLQTESYISVIPSTSAEQNPMSEQDLPGPEFNNSFANAFSTAEIITYNPYGSPHESSSNSNWLLWPFESTVLTTADGDEINFEGLITPGTDVHSYNLDLRGLFQYWGHAYDAQRSGTRLNIPNVPSIKSQNARFYAPAKVKISITDLDERSCDFQGINWSILGATRQDTREMRKRTYKNYTNITHHDSHMSSPAMQSLSVSLRTRAKEFHTNANYFRFRQMHRNFNASRPHFQLRHTISASSKHSVFFATKGKIWRANPQLDTVDCVMEFCEAHSESEVRPIEKVSALTASDGVLVIGGYDGSYALKSLSSGIDSPNTLGTLTPQERISHDGIGYTNHVCTFLDRHSGLPHAVFSNNDHYVRTLDCYSNRFIRVHSYGWAVNCTATSPDGRLRVIVGDTCSPWIVDAEKGDRIIRLPNHTDFGFACAWSPDGRHVATGNQDQIVQIWDSRAWKQPLEILSTELAGVRSMQFSPLGGGKPVLLLAEPADFVSVVDAQTFQSRQRFDFFGEIAGVSFIPDGSKFFVANTDAHFGGILEFDRVGDYGAYGRRRHGPPQRGELEQADGSSSEDAEELSDSEWTSTRAHGKRCGFEFGDLII